MIYVSTTKFLGANYGMMTVMPFANGSLEAPGLGLSENASTGASDLYVMPLQLGWHGNRFDATTGFAFFAPTGRHAAGASDNLGKGMWSYEARQLARHRQTPRLGRRSGIDDSTRQQDAPHLTGEPALSLGNRRTIQDRRAVISADRDFSGWRDQDPHQVSQAKQ
jgi:hypothetical protein